MSNINPANINGSYPIAGQDNDSQGFRDNFTNIKSNLTYARNELEDLAAKVVVKAALNVNGSTVENDMNGTDFYNVRVKNVRQIIDAVAIDASDIATMSVTNGSVKQIETVGHPAFAIDLVDTSEQIDGFASVRIQLAAQEPSQVITFPITVTIGGEYIEGFDVLNKTLTLVGGTESDPVYYWLELSTTDGWNTVTITDLNRNSINSVAHANSAGYVTINDQPNITSVGVLTSLKMIDTVGNAIIDGKIKFAEQSDVALDALHANIANSSITSSTVTSNAQPNITSVGTLTSLIVSGSVTANAFNGELTGNVIGTATHSISSQTASQADAADYVTEPIQTSITSVGTLSSLNVTGNISAANINGTLLTAAQPNVTSVGTLTSLTMADQNAVTINGKSSKSSVADSASVAQSLPTGTPTNIGAAGDTAGKIKLNGDYIYVCTGTYDGVTAIWKRATLSSF